MHCTHQENSIRSGQQLSNIPVDMGSIQQREIATLDSLADQIKELASKMTKQLEAEKIPPVTLEADSPIKYERLPGDLFMTRQLLEDALKDMWILSQGPSESVFNYVHMAIPDISCLNILNQFDFWNAVPLSGEASFEEVAKHVQLPVDVVSRVLAHAITMRFFTKPSPTAKSVQHTSRSAALAKDPGLVALVQMVLDETGPPMLVLPEALRQYSQGKPELTKNMKETAFKLCHSGGVWGDFENSWDFIENDGVAKGETGYETRSKGWRQRNFVKFMAYIKDLFNTEDIVAKALDWAGAGDVTVVDVSLTQANSNYPAPWQRQLTCCRSLVPLVTMMRSLLEDSRISSSSSKISLKLHPSSRKNSHKNYASACHSRPTTCLTRNQSQRIFTCSNGSYMTGLTRNHLPSFVPSSPLSSPAPGLCSSITWVILNQARLSYRGVSRALVLRRIFA
jgi:hypothetical protein